MTVVHAGRCETDYRMYAEEAYQHALSANAAGEGAPPGEEGTDQEKRLEALSRGYEDSPWLTALVDFSGFLVVLAGSFTALFLLGPAPTRRPRGALRGVPAA